MNTVIQQLYNAGMPIAKYRSVFDMISSDYPNLTESKLNKIVPLERQEEYRHRYNQAERARLCEMDEFFLKNPRLHDEYTKLVELIANTIYVCDHKDGTPLFHLFSKYPSITVWKDEKIWTTAFKKKDYIVLEYLVQLVQGPPIEINGMSFKDYLETDEFAKDNFEHGVY